MFKTELPDFYKDDSISGFFTPNINDLFNIKNNDYFSTEALSGFIEKSNELENALLDFVNITRQKIEYFEGLNKKYNENNQELRDLNSQLVVAKIERRSFGKLIQTDDEYNGEIMENIGG